MKTKVILTIILAFIMMLSPNDVFSQKRSKKKLIRVEVKDGTVLTGFIKRQNDKYLVLTSKTIGEIKVYKKNIRSIEYVTDSKKNVLPKKKRRHIDNRAKYFTSSSAYNLKKGQGYFSNTWILFNDVNYGLTDNFSVGGGIVPSFLFGGESTPVWLTTKFSLPIIKNRFNVSAGLAAWTLLGGYDDYTSALVANITATVGNPENNGSLSVYYIFNRYGGTSPIFNLKGKFKITNRTFFMGESYFSLSDEVFFDEGLFGLLGLRTMFLGGIDLDYALIVPIAGDLDGVHLLPYLGVHIAF